MLAELIIITSGHLETGIQQPSNLQEPVKIIVTTDDLNFTADSEAAKVGLVTAKFVKIFNF